MRILWKGPVFNPTGVSTASRETIRALVNRGHLVQCMDPWVETDYTKGLKACNYPLSTFDITVHYDYPNKWRDNYMTQGHCYYSFIHEGTRAHPSDVDIINNHDSSFFVCSKRVKNLFTWSGVRKKIKVVPYGYNPEIYKISRIARSKDFTFCNINSWFGTAVDRKGTAILLKAFDQEFGNEPNVKLGLKISTFILNRDSNFYLECIKRILGHTNRNIMINTNLLPEKDLAYLYNSADCFVNATRAEGFGLTILNSLACGCPVIIPKDHNSGYMDFCEGNPGVIFVDLATPKLGDQTFYTDSNYLAEPDISSLRAKMRWAYENRDLLPSMGDRGFEYIKDWTWDRAASIFEDVTTSPY